MDQEKQDQKQPETLGNSGIATGNYDFLPDLDSSQEDEFAGKEGVEVQYSFTGDDIREGLKAFQRAAIYKKYMIYTIILAVIFVIYLVNFAQDNQFLPGVLAVMCVAVIGMLWYFPYQHIKKTAEATDANPGMTFRMGVYDSGVKISDESGSFILHYGTEINRSLETENLFLVCVGKERIFLLPKRYLEGEQEAQVRELLKKGMGDKYTQSK